MTVSASRQRLQALGERHRRLGAVGGLCRDLALEEAYVEAVAVLVETAITTLAHDVEGMKLKAQLLVWCWEGHAPVPDPEAQDDRLLASLIGDLLAA